MMQSYSGNMGVQVSQYPRGPPLFENGYHPQKRKKQNHIVWVDIQDQAVNVCAKHSKLEKNGVFLVMFTNFGKDMTEELREKQADMHF